MKISPVIMVKDASKTIGQTLESLKSFDEVIVYDTGSVDNSIEIARKYKNANIYCGTFLGFGKSKNKAAELAKYDWILSIDADEILGPILLESIENLQVDESAVYRFKRYNYYRNRRIRHSGWGKEYVTRIYNRTKMGFNDKLVHENIESGNAKIQTLKGELMHFSYHSISDFIRKRDLYAELFAMENVGKRETSPFMALIRGAFDFFNTYIIKKGIFDGYRGLLIAVSNANVSFFKYLKLYEANIYNDKRISLIIDALDQIVGIEQTLKSALFQNIPPSEIVIVYNRFNDDIFRITNEFEKRSFIPVVHAIFDKKESGVTKWTNRIIPFTNCNYLIFVESGLILDKNFIHHHSRYSKKNHYLQGETILIDSKLCKFVLNNDLKKSLLLPAIKFKNRINTFAFTSLFYFNHCEKEKENYHLIYGNFSFFKDDLFIDNKLKENNGYKNQVDLNLIEKLKSSGLKRQNLKFVGLQFKFSNINENPKLAQTHKVLICLDRLKYLNCGLGQISLNLGRNLLENENTRMDYSFLLPAKGFAEFDKKVESVRLTTLRSFFPWFMKKYDLCHVTHQLPKYNFGAAKKNILTIHDLNFIYTKSKSKSKRYVHKLQKNIYKSDAIVFISEFTKETSYKYLDIPSDKIVRVIYNGVEPPDSKEEKPKWLVSENFLFSIGQFLEKKNFHVLIPFIKLLPENISLIIAGENETHYGQKMKNLVKENYLEHRVILPGGISETQKNYLYHNCSAFVFPSIAEGFGLPVIEAMLCNKPVFCSNRTSLKEIGGRFAFFWENFEPATMLEVYYKGLEIFKNDKFKHKQMDYANTFTHAKNTQEYIKLYKELLGLH